MKAIEMFAPEVNEPILCKDGKLGLVIRNYPQNSYILNHRRLYE
jgi:hypothetical protein